MTDTEAIANVIAAGIKAALVPVVERLAAAEARLDLAVKGASQALADLAPVSERLAVVEVRPVVPGPPGEPGPPGKDGADGKAGLTYQGVHQEGKTYDLGDVVTWAGAAWHCNEATTTKPGEYAGAKAWTLMVKKGRDGKDGKP